MTDAEKDAAKIYILEHAEDVFEKWTGKAKKRINGKNSYICPFCGNGSGESGTGIAWNPKAKSGNEWTCFLCNRSGDIFDYWLEKNNLDPRRDFPKAIEQIAGFMGYSFLSGTGKAYYSPAEIAAQRTEIEEKSRAREKENQEKQEKEAGRIKKELDAARRKLVENPDGPARKYLEKRGFKYFDEIFSEKYGLGYLDNWRGYGARLIIKTSDTSYFCRDIRDEIPESGKGYEKMSPGGKNFFNLSAIWESDSPVIVVEGEIDALSLISLNKGDVGALERVEAVALGSTKLAGKFAEICRQTPPKAPLIIALDNDDAGRQASGELLNLLYDAKIPAIGYNVAGKYNDPNEALQAPNGDTNLLHRVATAKTRARMFSFSPIKKESTIQPERTEAAGMEKLTDKERRRRAELEEWIRPLLENHDRKKAAAAGQPTTQPNESLYKFDAAENYEPVAGLPDDYVLSAEEVAAQQQAEKESAERAEYLEKTKSDAAYLDDFLNPAKKAVAKIPTGFPKFDDLLGGGLRAGLYVLGAITSLGKSTFCLQLAGQIAETGQDVLNFSLEMMRDELMAKTLSRLTYQRADKYGKAGDTADAKTSQEITDFDERQKFTDAENELLRAAVADYAKFAGNIHTIERTADFTVFTLCDIVRKHIKYTGKKPVVIIDYLQYLEPYAPNIDTRKNIDKSVREIKALSMEHGLTIIAISSFNRENYFSPVALNSFKESGGVEYTADVLMGLQHRGMDYTDDNGNERPFEDEGARKKRIWRNQQFAAKAAAEGNWIALELKVLKNRNGALGKVKFEFMPKYNLFGEGHKEVAREIEAGRINSLPETTDGSGYDSEAFDDGD